MIQPSTPLTPRAPSDNIPLPDGDKDFWLAYRNSMLMLLDAIERRLKICPTTAELRQRWKQTN
jgi:hypothetical protein